jgi:hypothetical protein
VFALIPCGPLFGVCSLNLSAKTNEYCIEMGSFAEAER